MASWVDSYKQKKDAVEFFKELTGLVDKQALKVGQTYTWPEKYYAGWITGELEPILTEVLIGTGLSYSNTGNAITIVVA